MASATKYRRNVTMTTVQAVTSDTRDFGVVSRYSHFHHFSGINRSMSYYSILTIAGSTKPKPEEPTPTDPNEIPDYDPHDGFGDLESNVFAGTTHGVRSRESVVIDIELN